MQSCRDLGQGVGAVGIGSMIAFWLLLQEEVDMLHDVLGLSYSTNDSPYEQSKTNVVVKKV